MPGARRCASLSPERFAAERGRRGRSSKRRCGAPATGRRSSGATACAGSATLYRAAAADLAFARRRFPGEPLVGAAGGARAAGAGDGLRALRAARLAWSRSSRAATGGGSRSGRCWCWPRGCCCRARRWPAASGARSTRPTAAGLIPAQFQAAADPPAEGRDYDPETASAFSFSVMFNNIQVTLVAFAGGITFGVADGLRAVLQRAAAGGDRRPGDRRGQRHRVPAADLLARAAGDLVHRRRRRSPGCGSGGR